MSYRIASLVIRAYTGPPDAFRVLCVLADYADDRGVAWPTVAALGARARLSPRRVRELLAILDAGKWLRVIGSRAGGRALSVRRAINLDRLKNLEADFPLSDPENPAADRTLSPSETLRRTAENPATHRRKPCGTPHPKQSEKLSRSDQRQRAPQPPRQDRPPDRRPQPAVASLPVWVDPAAWKEFADHRKALGKGRWTPKAQELNLAKLATLRAEGHDPIAVIHQSIANGWVGLFPINNRHQRNHKSSNRDAFANELYGDSHETDPDQDDGHVIESTATAHPD